MIEFYMKERGSLIQNIRTILTNSSGFSPLSSFELIRKNLVMGRQGQTIVSQIIESLKRNVNWQKEFTCLAAEQHREKVFACL